MIPNSTSSFTFLDLHFNTVDIRRSLALSRNEASGVDVVASSGLEFVDCVGNTRG